MRYCGSKRRFMKYLLPIIMEGTTDNTVFVDVFGGGMNVVSEIPLKNKLANDINRYIISLWKHLQKHKVKGERLLPLINDHVTEDEYNSVKVSFLNETTKGKYTDAEIGFVATALSYGGAFFNGYAKYNPKKKEDHVKEAYNGMLKQMNSFKYLESTTFINVDYRDITSYIGSTPSDTILFCDPPYFGTRKYLSDFDSEQFWNWARQKSKEGYKVYICEYDAPSDFECIWQKDKRDGMGTTITGRRQSVKVEKMFKYKG